ncbi:hypothetical protein JQ597_19290 [Bradyrhizobium sp. AUGA SZCCT0177]|uniref:hypothetical protein n=1 Tax=Bradyrhizobium sp. AUGA SZCCT0177 TaxID=2807665 RepID=UPI001BAAE219|nr:hypothetical protein [Bradyrhizobium sp. AUGA SZCCT0177]MBR1284197.1 hypothetical protein [Bradyrhizobium sp. AUGA SZCCT0177]
MRVEFYGLRLDLPAAWADVTEGLPGGSPPSLARPTGAGAIQFSIAKYRSGEEPNVTTDSLRALLEEFCQRNDMPRGTMVDCEGKLISVEASAVTNGELIRARYFSNGRDIVLGTYVCSDVDNYEMKEDLRDYERIMNSVDF